MPKQTKITMLGLIALLTVSIAINITQCSSSTTVGNKAVNDSLILLKDSVKKQNDSIKEMRNSLAQIEEQANKISSNNITPVESIKRITKKSK